MNAPYITPSAEFPPCAEKCTHRQWNPVRPGVPAVPDDASVALLLLRASIRNGRVATSIEAHTLIATGFGLSMCASLYVLMHVRCATVAIGGQKGAPGQRGAHARAANARALLPSHGEQPANGGVQERRGGPPRRARRRQRHRLLLHATRRVPRRPDHTRCPEPEMTRDCVFLDAQRRGPFPRGVSHPFARVKGALGGRAPSRTARSRWTGARTG